MSIVCGLIGIATLVNPEDPSIGEVFEQHINEPIVVRDEASSASLLTSQGLSVFLGAGCKVIELLCSLILEADLGSTCGKDLQVIANEGWEALRGKLRMNVICHSINNFL